jgi:hypothetical protein
MTARELRLDVDGIRATSFERPRRIEPEAARQQCTCGTLCYSDCREYCGIGCEPECYNQCLWDPEKQATAMTSPHTMSSSTALSMVNQDYRTGELY